MKLYDTLDIKRNATQKEIKDAYRRKAKEHHPDKSFSHHYKGGNSKAFVPIAKAYLILSDVLKRKRYDETGIEDDVKSSAMAANGLLQKMFGELIDKVGIEKILSTDVVGTIEKNLVLGTKKLKEEKEKAVSKKKAFVRVMKRIKHKDGHNNLSVVVTNQIENETRQLVKILKNMETVKIAREMLRDYSFKFDKAEEPSSFRRYTISFNAGTGGW